MVLILFLVHSYGLSCSLFWHQYSWLLSSGFVSPGFFDGNYKEDNAGLLLVQVIHMNYQCFPCVVLVLYFSSINTILTLPTNHFASECETNEELKNRDYQCRHIMSQGNIYIIPYNATGMLCTYDLVTVEYQVHHCRAMSAHRRFGGALQGKVSITMSLPDHYLTIAWFRRFP